MTEGKRDEFEKIYNAMFPKMMCFARTFCRDRDEAEDVTQDAFLKAFAAFDDCQDTQRLGNWLRRIIYRTFLDHKRIESRRVKECGTYGPDLELTVEDHADSAKSPEEILMLSQFEPDLEKAIRELDYEGRQLISLVYIQDQGHPDASKKMGIGSQSSRSRAHRLCTKMRKSMSPTVAPIPVK